MSIEKEIDYLKYLIELCLNDVDSDAVKQFTPTLENISQIFSKMHESEKIKYNQDLDEIYFQLQKLQENEKKIQDNIKKEISMIDKKSNAFNAYSNAEKLGS